MQIIKFGALALSSAVALGAATPAAAVITTLDFTGNICGAAGNQACGNSSQIGQNYGDRVGVDVSYRSASPATGVTYEPFLKFWDAGYGDLRGVVWGGPDPVTTYSEITFTALPGYELTLLGFDAGCYLNRASCQGIGYQISVINGPLALGAVAQPPANGHDTESFSLGYTNRGLILSWQDGYDGGFDNIRFDVRAIGASAVPEPSTWALLILGFGLAGAAMRRKPRVSTAFRMA